VSASELVDIVDDNDQVIDIVTRAEMRAARLRHRCVYIILLDSNDRIFVHRRTLTKDVYPGFWDATIGGVVASGEGYDEGASREVAEEVGLSDVPLTRLFPFSYEDAKTRVAGMVYSCTSDQPLRLQAEEIVEGRWATADELVQLTKCERFCPDGLVVLNQFLREGRTAASRGSRV
jgi:isopentenyldiphosphate isomerase